MTQTLIEGVEPAPAPVAWMWQHDETGRTGFVECWQVENGWQESNPRLLLTTPLYAAPVAAAQPTKADRVHAIVNAGPFPGMSEAFDAHMGAECWTDPAYAPDAATWAAAWKAAKAQPTQEPDASLTVAHMGGYAAGQRARQPLTAEQITAMRQAGYLDADDYPDAWAYERGVRDAERAHKIGEQA